MGSLHPCEIVLSTIYAHYFMLEEYHELQDLLRIVDEGSEEEYEENVRVIYHSKTDNTLYCLGTVNRRIKNRGSIVKSLTDWGVQPYRCIRTDKGFECVPVSPDEIDTSFDIDDVKSAERELLNFFNEYKQRVLNRVRNYRFLKEAGIVVKDFEIPNVAIVLIDEDEGVLTIYIYCICELKRS